MYKHLFAAVWDSQVGWTATKRLHILFGKLFRIPVARIYAAHRHRLFLNRRAMREKVHLVRQIRGESRHTDKPLKTN